MSQMPQQAVLSTARAARSRSSRVTVSAVRADTTCPPCPRRRTTTRRVAMNGSAPARGAGAGTGPLAAGRQLRHPGAGPSADRPARARTRAASPLPSDAVAAHRLAGLPGLRRALRPAAGARRVPAAGAGPAGRRRSADRRPRAPRCAWPAGRAGSTSDGYCENCGHAQPRERDHMEQECGPLAAVSDRGLRHHRNEDAFGLGQHRAARRLARVRGRRLRRRLLGDPPRRRLAGRVPRGERVAARPRCRSGTHPQQAMHDAIVAASHAVNALAAEPATAREHSPHQNAPACTIVGSVVTPGLLVVGWVGDSRAYWIPVDRSLAPGPAHRGRLVGRADGRRGPDERGGGVRRRARPRHHGLARRGRLRTGAAHRFLQAGPARCGGGVHGRAVELRGGGRGDGRGRARWTPRYVRCTAPASWSATPWTAGATTT